MTDQPVENEATAAVTEDEFLLRHLPGSSSAMRRLRQEISVLNSHRGSSLVHLILLRGESGVGKGYVARALAAHRRWLKIKDTDEYAGPDVGINPYLTGFQSILLPALPESLIESELFGHKKGAFTGADKARDGLLKQDYSDILLDEIGDASPVLQGKLLGVLEDRHFLPLGAAKDDRAQVTARLLAATNKHLEQLIKNGSFREDLYWRIIEHQLRVPALREQPENIPALCANILTELTADMAGLEVPEDPRLMPADLTWASSYAWPGNVRQLKHALRLWLLDRTTTPLADIVVRTNALRPRNLDDTNIEATVRAYLNECLENATSAADTLDDLQRTYERRVQHAVCMWYREQRNNLAGDALQSLFPGMKLASIKVKLSQWKSRGGQE